MGAEICVMCGCHCYVHALLPSCHNNKISIAINLSYLNGNKQNALCGNSVVKGVRITAGDQTPTAYFGAVYYFIAVESSRLCIIYINQYLVSTLTTKNKQY